MKKLVLLAALLSAILFITAGSAWDTYVFVQSTLYLCKGMDPYEFSHSVRAFIPGLGPMWIAYPPAMLFVWSLFVCPLAKLGVPLGPLYLWAVKAPSVLALVLAAYIAEKFKKGTWYWVLFNPISISAIIAHGMFDSLTALLLLIAVYEIEKKRDLIGSGLSLGLSIAVKQHALLALPAFAYHLLRKHTKREMFLFGAFAFLGFLIPLMLYAALFGTKALSDTLSVFIFHAERPPNALGFGGFAVISLYGDALGGYGGNLADATLLHGTAVSLHSVVTLASLPAIAFILLSASFDLPLAISLAYISYILLFYVGALQHMVVPAVLLPITLNNKKLLKAFNVSFLFYSVSHLVAFWDIFPMLTAPLFLRPFNLWLGYLSRVADAFVPGWDLALKVLGIIFTSLGLLVLLYSTSVTFSLKKRLLAFLLPLSYVLELLVLALMLKSYAVPSLPHVAYGTKLCGVIPWENLEYPGEKFGDFISPYAVPPKEGYYSLVLPIANEIARAARVHDLEILVAARLDLIRAYETSDLLSALISHKVKWAWLVIVGSEEDYLQGIASAPPSSFNALAKAIKANIPMRGYFELSGILGFLNATLLRLPEPVYPYPTSKGKPVVYVIVLNDVPREYITNVIKALKEEKLEPIILKNVALVNVKLSALSRGAIGCQLPFASQSS